MFSVRLRGVSFLYLSIQILGVLVILWSIYALINSVRFNGALSASEYVVTTVVVLVASILEFATRSQATRFLGGLSNRQLNVLSQRQALFTLVFIFGTMVMTKDDGVSRVFLTAFFCVYFLWILWTNRFGFRMLVHYLYSNGQKGMLPTLVVGAPTAVQTYLNNPRRPCPPGTDLCGFIPLSAGNDTMSVDLQMMGSFGNLKPICEEARIKALLLLGINDRIDLVSPLEKISSELGIRTTWIDDVEQHHGKGSTANHSENYSVVTPIREPLEDPINRAAKRVFDLVFSLVGLMFLLPPAMVFVAMLHRRNSPGPLFYKQERTGRHGEIFQVYKFRSMTVSKNDEFTQAKEGDVRIFPGGELIRKYSIDELPQFINVFMGQMSIVGPRPHPVKMPEMLAIDTKSYRMRNLSKPGITGLAQSRGWRGETSESRQITNRIKMDLFYISHWSLFFDVRIIIETAYQLLSPPKSAR